MKRLLITASLVGLAAGLLTGCGVVRKHRNRDLAAPVSTGDQPDKILFEKATNEINHGRYDIGRLTLQTMMNTYPDSEYLAKAKLAIADSYYKEGGISGLTQAEIEYRDFITFFPTAPEAPEAQFRIGMAHFHLMGKPDRDRQEALLAEIELKEFLLKYPDNPLMPRVKTRLREVQEVLGDSDYRIARFYFMRGALPAAKGRFQEIVENYPNYSNADQASWYLGQTYEKMRQTDKAVPCYRQIITEYPLSSMVDDAKERLTALHQPIPKPTKAEMARAQADAVSRSRPGTLAKVTGIMSSAPDVSATRRGPVRLGSKPSPVEAAKTAAPTPSGASISVQQVGESALQNGQAVDTKPAGAADSNSGAASASNPTTPADSAKPQQGSSSNPATANPPAASQSAAQPDSSQSPDPSGQPKKKKKSRLRKLLLF